MSSATIAAFLGVVGPAGSSPQHHDIPFMQSLFVQDTPQGNPMFPNIGLTTGGPQFTGQRAIGILFQELFTSFPDLVFAPANGLRLTDGNTIGIEATLSTGIQVAAWSPGGNASHPLSPIVPDKKHRSDYLPVCAIFTFGGNCLIQNLGLYFDRWKLAIDLWDGSNPPHLDIGLRK
jgi:hypothetical protein